MQKATELPMMSLTCKQHHNGWQVHDVYMRRGINYYRHVSKRADNQTLRYYDWHVGKTGRLYTTTR